MKFYQRLAYYSFGVLLGAVFVGFVLTKKGARCSYFPNERVLNNIRTKPLKYSLEASRKLAEDWIDTIDIKNTLQYGDVDFDKSNIKVANNGKQYIIEGYTTKKDTILLTVINYETRAVLEDIIRVKSK
ncbi:MAG: hypothetical protein RL607_481 [Bacteroidota bacterium]|jgi:hypothetical protein